MRAVGKSPASLTHAAFWVGFFLFLMVATIMLGVWKVCHEVIIMLQSWASPQPATTNVNPSTSSPNAVAGTATSPPLPLAVVLGKSTRVTNYSDKCLVYCARV